MLITIVLLEKHNTTLVLVVLVVNSSTKYILSCWHKQSDRSVCFWLLYIGYIYGFGFTLIGRWLKMHCRWQYARQEV